MSDTPSSLIALQRRFPDDAACARCSKQTSVTAGTAMQGSKLALMVWFWAAHLMASHSNGISASQLWKLLGLGSYTIEPIIRLSRHARACHGHPWIAGTSPAMTTEE